MNAFLTAFFYVFIAEIGDKTQLLTVAFTSRFRAPIVLGAVAVAAALVNLLSVGLGEATGKLLPLFWINCVAGLAFLIFGILELKREDDTDERERASKLGPFLTVMLSFLVAEITDKTMLASFAVATKEQSFWPVWAGSTLGLVGSNALAVMVGSFLRRTISAERLRLAIAGVYLLSGVIILTQNFAHLSG